MKTIGKAWGGVVFGLFLVSGCQTISTISTAIANASPPPSKPKLLLINNNPATQNSPIGSNAAVNAAGSYEVLPSPPMIYLEALHPQYLTFNVYVNNQALKLVTGSTSQCYPDGCFFLASDVYENQSNAPILDMNGDTQTIEKASIVLPEPTLDQQDVSVSLTTQSLNPQYSTQTASTNIMLGSRVPGMPSISGLFDRNSLTNPPSYSFNFNIQLGTGYTQNILVTDSGGDLTFTIPVSAAQNAAGKLTYIEGVAASVYAYVNGCERFYAVASNEAGSSAQGKSGIGCWAAYPAPGVHPTVTPTPGSGGGACSGSTSYALGNGSYTEAPVNGIIQCTMTNVTELSNSLNSAEQCAKTADGGTWGPMDLEGILLVNNQTGGCVNAYVLALQSDPGAAVSCMSSANPDWTCTDVTTQLNAGSTWDDLCPTMQ